MSKKIPTLQFDFRDLTSEAKRRFGNHVGDITINLPFVSFSVNPTSAETEAAKEIAIRLKNRRVLDSKECCDHCIDEALDSLQTIRQLLVDKQVELSHATESTLYLLTEYMLEAIRQFLTFKQRLDQADTDSDLHLPSDFHRPQQVREKYFAALEILRGHLNGCRKQIAAIGDISLPSFKSNLEREEAWKLEAYKQPKMMEDGSKGP